MDKWVTFYEEFCKMKEEQVRKEYDKVCEEYNRMEKDGEDEDELMIVEGKMCRMYVMMESMGMMK